LAAVSSAGASADNSSAEMSSRYWSGTMPEGPGVSLVTDGLGDQRGGGSEWEPIKILLEGD
jgi:hypothetical protein